MNKRLKTPVALIIFRRPELTARVFAEIRKARPEKLFIIADGPRPDNAEDEAACAAARAAVEHVDWDCEVHRDYAESNMGCRLRPPSGLSWVFEHVEEAIILEDDCVPSPSFFRYCEEMLERYREDLRVMHIAGCTYRDYDLEVDESYYFSRLIGAWGWATWRRAWELYDLDVERWDALRNSTWLEGVLEEDFAVSQWAEQFDNVRQMGDAYTTWDYQWAFACWVNSALAIVPQKNLITNVGTGDTATHTFVDCEVTNLPLKEMPFPMSHPPTVLQGRDMDQRMLQEDRALSIRIPPSLPTRIKRFFSRRLSPLFGSAAAVHLPSLLALAQEPLAALPV